MFQDIIHFFLHIRWKVQQLLSSWEAKRLSEQLSTIEKLDPERAQSGAIRQAALNRAWLMKIIPEFPTWAEGHLAFAIHSLTVGDIEAAYAASFTAEKILTTSRKVIARGIRGVALLRHGDFLGAEPLLKAAYVSGSAEIDFAEEFVACLIALKKFEEADKVLKRSTTREVSPQQQIAQAYVSEKLAK